MTSCCTCRHIAIEIFRKRRRGENSDFFIKWEDLEIKVCRFQCGT